MSKQRAIISDKLLVEKTGEPLEHWYVRLDRKGAKTLSGEEIYLLVTKIPALKPLGEWNQNLLATSYMWSRGIRERGERKGGFEVSVSKTVQIPLPKLYRAFTDDALRKKWLGAEKIVIRKSTENKSARITWSDGKTSLSVDFYPKAAGKSQVVVQHQKIQSADDAEKLKGFWSDRLGRLKSQLEVS